MSLREKAMKVIPSDTLSREKFPHTGGHFPPYVGLKRLCIVVMFKFCSGSGRLFSGRPERKTFGS